MSKQNDHHQKMANLTYAEVYPCYVTKVEKKGRTVAELQQVTEWLTGFDEAELQAHIDNHPALKTSLKQPN